MPEGSHGRWEPELDADERTMLTGFLDYHRATLRWKVSRLTQAQLAQRIEPATLTLAGIVKHLALVEDNWFTDVFAGTGPVEPWASVDWDADRDWDMHSAIDHSPDDLLELYEAACARSRAVIASADSLDERSVGLSRDTAKPFTLRWILVHMIEETARHNGHADLLREAIDGETGE